MKTSESCVVGKKIARREVGKNRSKEGTGIMWGEQLWVWPQLIWSCWEQTEGRWTDPTKTRNFKVLESEQEQWEGLQEPRLPRKLQGLLAEVTVLITCIGWIMTFPGACHVSGSLFRKDIVMSCLNAEISFCVYQGPERKASMYRLCSVERMPDPLNETCRGEDWTKILNDFVTSVCISTADHRGQSQKLEELPKDGFLCIVSPFLLTPPPTLTLFWSHRQWFSLIRSYWAKPQGVGGRGDMWNTCFLLFPAHS